MAQNFFFRKATIPGSILENFGNHYDGIASDEEAIKSYTFRMFINGALAVVSGGYPEFSFEDFHTGDVGYLIGATVTMEGDYGSLMRFEVNCKLSQNTFDDFDENFLIVGADVTITFRGNDNSKFSDLESRYQAKLYDFSWTINPDGTVDINMKAVGAGQSALYTNIFEGAGAAYAGLEYRADYDDSAPTKSPVTGLADFIDYYIQASTGTLDADDFAPIETATNNAGYGFFIRWHDLRGDDLFNSEYAINQDLLIEDTRGIYITLGFILDTLNAQFSNAATPTNISFNAEANLKYDIGFLPSANPIECIFCYGSHGGQQPTIYSKIGSTVGQASSKDTGYAALGSAAHATFNMDSGGLRDILINRDLIRGIFKEATSIKYSGNTVKFAGIELSVPEYFLTVDTFFTKLFSIIKANSGGAIDLILIPDENATASVHLLKIYNLRGPENFFEPFTFKRGAIGIRDIKIVSKVPSATAAAAFGARGVSGDSDSEKAGKAISLPGSSEEGVEEQGSGYPTSEELSNAKFTAQYDDFNASAVDGLRAVIKRIVDNESTEKTVEKTTIAWPIELTITTVGVDGWKFGDTISYEGLPKRYRDARGKVKVGFTITRVVHTFGTEWTTGLTSQCRFVGSGA